MRPRCPQNIWKVCVCVCVSVLAAHSCFLCLCVPAMCIGVWVFFLWFFFLHTLANTHFTHNPWRFLSWSHVSDLIGCCINNTALTQLPTPHPTGNISRTAALTDHLFLFISAAAVIGVDSGFVYTCAPGVNPGGLRAGLCFTCGWLYWDFTMNYRMCGPVDVLLDTNVVGLAFILCR